MLYSFFVEIKELYFTSIKRKNVQQKKDNKTFSQKGKKMRTESKQSGLEIHESRLISWHINNKNSLETT